MVNRVFKKKYEGTYEKCISYIEKSKGKAASHIMYAEVQKREIFMNGSYICPWASNSISKNYPKEIIREGG